MFNLKKKKKNILKLWARNSRDGNDAILACSVVHCFQRPNPVRRKKKKTKSLCSVCNQVLFIGATLAAKEAGAVDDCWTPTPFQVVEDLGLTFPNYPIECYRVNRKPVTIVPEYCDKNQVTPFRECCDKKKNFECTWDNIRCPGLILYYDMYCQMINNPTKLPKYAQCSCSQCVNSTDAAGRNDCPLRLGKCAPTALKYIPVTMICYDLYTQRFICINLDMCLPKKCGCFT
ncbi:unnamed protein product [Lymnaea stagnalis]|uniref:Uncharacterized protein n=1 Tax=Lymnaea stagnalis TaxID=6523 RepID=A0AAV2I945_LYMST